MNAEEASGGRGGGAGGPGGSLPQVLNVETAESNPPPPQLTAPAAASSSNARPKRVKQQQPGADENPSEPKRRTGGTSRRWRPFPEALEYVHSLGIKSTKDWEIWRKSSARPGDIPSNPYRSYQAQGWLSWTHWLGNEPGSRRPPKTKPQWRQFVSALKFAHSLQLTSQHAWKKRAGEKPPNWPSDIPAEPDQVYAKCGWVSW